MIFDTKKIKNLPFHEKIKVLNEIKIELHKISPFKDNPVDCVIWVKSKNIQSNDYNPNHVANPEMDLLKTSIIKDGFTQPIVTFLQPETREIVDGFHRSLIGKEMDKFKGYLPVTTINKETSERCDRIASTIRHNRARGKHQVQSMSKIVSDLKRMNWTDNKIKKYTGMDDDELIRLRMVTGLADLYKNHEYSNALNVE